MELRARVPEQMEGLNSRLHLAWLNQLSREYDDICYQYGFSLQPPILRISQSRTQLGSWLPSKRILSLSHFLISAHPWRLTLQVFKHEIAHQICDEVFGQPGAGHGPLFRQACTQLGLDVCFQHAAADLSEGIPELDQGTAVTGPGRRIVEKVRKLLALGCSDNEHEAALALQRAGELLTRHQLDMDALAREEGLVHRTISTGRQRLAEHRKVIAVLLERCFAVRVVCATEYDPQADCSYKTIELLGSEESVAIAEHCYFFLENRLEALWQTNRHAFAGNRRLARRSYYLGLLAGFGQTLQTAVAGAVGPSEDSRTTGTTLPVAQRQQRLAAFVNTRFPRLHRRRGRPSVVHGQAYHQAVIDGREIRLHHPMAGTGPTGLLR